VEDTKNSYGWQAATLNPAQLTLCIHTENKSLEGYELYAWAPVNKVTEANDGKWNVQTSRGNVLADKVIYATNAYSQALIPELEGLITPMRGVFWSRMES
jgi:glycine/D-amino acid oxidase-like deaminating enzyme